MPIQKGWDPIIDEKCINYKAEALAAYAINIFADPCILSMPSPLVLRLNMSASKKRGLIVAFSTGGMYVETTRPFHLRYFVNTAFSACIVSLVQISLYHENRRKYQR